MNHSSFTDSEDHCRVSGSDSLFPAHWLFWDDRESREPALNPAIDEALLEHASLLNVPLLRLYSWSCASVTIGRSQDFPAELGERFAVLRRPTGGGVVFHDADVTYTLIFPAAHPFLRLNRLESYRVIHEALLTKLPNRAILTTEGTSDVNRRTMRCFDSPSRFDIVTPDGGKYAGAAQRRTRSGLLHQGSVRLTATDGDRPQLERLICEAFAEYFRIGYQPWAPPAPLQKRAQELASNCYERTEWNRCKKCLKISNN